MNKFTPLLFLALAACQDTVGAPVEILRPQPVEQLHQCGADKLQHLLGQTDHVIDDNRLHGRIIRPGQAVTMDHSPARLNFQLSEAAVIVRIFCG